MAKRKSQIFDFFSFSAAKLDNARVKFLIWVNDHGCRVEAGVVKKGASPGEGGQQGCLLFYNFLITFLLKSSQVSFFP